jgi:single-strand DNA-binding protein
VRRGPRFCGTARLCFGFAALRVSAFRKSLCNERKRFSEPSEKAPLGLGSGAHSRRCAQECPEGNPGKYNQGEKAMALYENKITLKGYLGKNAENIATRQQRTFTVLSLASKSGYKDKQTQQWINHTEWHRIVAFGKPADYAKGLKKGDYVEVEGELRSTEYDAEVGDGKKKSTVKRRGWEIRANIVRKLAQPESSRGENLDAEPITEEDAA